MKKNSSYIINKKELPEKFPTHKHQAEFCESLGRAVATFGFLEETLAKAIFVLSATRPYHPDKIDEEYEKWLPMLERTLSDPLGSLINTYGKCVKNHPSARITNIEELIEKLTKFSKLRNLICHGSWGLPDSHGASVPFFINRQKEFFKTAINCAWLNQLQSSTAELACEVINTVTHMGFQFPGSNGPGKEVYPTNKN